MNELEKLMEGSRRFAGGKYTARRKELTEGQKPFATIVCCSDSRVPPEHIFDVGLGDIFIVRVAGNVVGPLAIGSVEYGVEHLHTPLLMVLGHEKCGAVTAACKGGHAEGYIKNIVEMIAPAVENAKKSGKQGDELVELATVENVKKVMEELLSKSSIVKKLVDGKKLKLVGAKYSMATGKVEMI